MAICSHAYTADKIESEWNNIDYYKQSDVDLHKNRGCNGASLYDALAACYTDGITDSSCFPAKNNGSTATSDGGSGGGAGGGVVNPNGSGQASYVDKVGNVSTAPSYDVPATSDSTTFPFCYQLQGMQFDKCLDGQTAMRRYRAKTCYNVDSLAESIKHDLVKYGPVLAGMMVFEDFLTSYDGKSVYAPKKGAKEAGGHCCLPDASITVLGSGYKRADQVVVGDQVLTRGGWREVEELLPRVVENAKLYTIYSNLFARPLELTEGHPVLIARPSNEARFSAASKWWTNLQWMPVQDVTDRDYVVSQVNSTVLAPSAAVSPEFCRLLGYYVGDGSIGYRKYRVRDPEGPGDAAVKWRTIPGDTRRWPAFVSLTYHVIKKQDVVSDMIATVARLYPTINHKATPRENTQAGELVFYSAELARQLEMWCGGPGQKRLHSELLFMDPALQLELIRGWWRTDGTGEWDSSRCKIWTQSLVLAEQLVHLLQRCRMTYSVERISPEQQNKVILGKVCVTRGGYSVRFHTPRPNDRGHYQPNGLLYKHVQSVAVSMYTGAVHNYHVREHNEYHANNVLIHNCISIYGYGVDRAAGPYWLIKNSWGADWGDQGFFRLQQGNPLCQLEQNVVGMIPDFPGMPVSDPNIVPVETPDEATVAQFTAHFIDPTSGYYNTAIQAVAAGKLSVVDPLTGELTSKISPYLLPGASLPDYSSFYAMDALATAAAIAAGTSSASPATSLPASLGGGGMFDQSLSTYGGGGGGVSSRGWVVVVGVVVVLLVLGVLVVAWKGWRYHVVHRGGSGARYSLNVPVPSAAVPSVPVPVVGDVGLVTQYDLPSLTFSSSLPDVVGAAGGGAGGLSVSPAAGGGAGGLSVSPAAGGGAGGLSVSPAAGGGGVNSTASNGVVTEK